ncbi:MAG: PstS family phosphate ABC transporter substrate-binding protein [Haloplanus sp.]
MARDSKGRFDSVSRRKFIVAAGTSGGVALAGCSGGGNDNSGGGNANTATDAPTTATPAADKNSKQTASSSSSKWSNLLSAGGSSTVYPITSDGASYWNYNAPTSDQEHWPNKKYGIDTDLPFADYWASTAGYDADGDKGTLPWHVAVGLSHSGVGLSKVKAGQVDIGDASAPVTAEMPDHDQAYYDKFVNHVVGIDAMQISVSRSIYDAGVKQLTKEEVVQVYSGQVENWKDLGGPDKDIQCVGRVEGSGTRTIFHERMLDGGKAPGVDVHKGENQQVASTVANSDNAIGYLAWAFVGDKNPAIDLKVGSEVYSQQNDNLGKKSYPLNRDLHCYTYEGTSPMASAFLNMIISDMGQDMLVKKHNYITLPDSRQKEEKKKLNLK